jgi:hypothetical protein
MTVALLAIAEQKQWKRRGRGAQFSLLSQVAKAKAEGKRKWQGKEALPAPLPGI